MCRSTNYYTLCVGSEGFSTPYTDFISRFRLSFFTRRGRRPPGRYIYGVPDARPPAPSGAQGHIPHHHHAIEATTSHTQHVKSTCTWHRHATAAAMMRAARVRRRAVDAGCRCMCHRPEGRLSARTDATVTHATHTTPHTHTPVIDPPCFYFLVRPGLVLPAAVSGSGYRRLLPSGTSESLSQRPGIKPTLSQPRSNAACLDRCSLRTCTSLRDRRGSDRRQGER